MLKKYRHLYLVGCLLIILSLVLWVGKSQAATLTYQSTWTIPPGQSYRTTWLVDKTGQGWSTGKLCLGPSKWIVTTNDTGNNQQLSIENWSVSQYFDSDNTVNSAAVEPHYQTLALSDCSDYSGAINPPPYDTENGRIIRPTGLYGGFSTFFCNTSYNNSPCGLDSWNLNDDLIGLRSMPKIWTVIGELDE